MKKNILFALTAMLLIFQTGVSAQNANSFTDENAPHETWAYISNTKIAEDGTPYQTSSPVYAILTDNGNALLYNQYVYSGTWQNTEDGLTEITDCYGSVHKFFNMDDGQIALYSMGNNYLIQEYADPPIFSIAEELWQKGLPGFYRTTPELLGLSDIECNELCSKAQELTERFGVAVNILIVNDFTEYTPSDNMYNFTEEVEGGYNLGINAETGSGILLALSMADRDYNIWAYESPAKEIFNDYSRGLLEDAMLSYLHDNNWTGGLNAYLDKCEFLLSESADGNIIDGQPRCIWLEIVIAGLIGLFIGAIARASVKHHYGRRVAEETAASNYIVDDSFALSHKRDLYSHTTETRQYSPKSSSSSSGGSRGGCRGGHSGGKF